MRMERLSDLEAKAQSFAGRQHRSVFKKVNTDQALKKKTHLSY